MRRTLESGPFRRHWRDIASRFLHLGATSFGGPAILGIMQVELQEKREWVSRERFLEGLSLVNMLPGATATQLGIFLGYARGGWWGGLLGGACFVLPGFVVMVLLTLAYAALGVTPLMRGALYGLGPVVLGIFLVAVYRLGRSAVSAIPQAIILAAAALTSIFTPLGVGAILLLAGGVGLLLFHSAKLGVVVVGALAFAFVVLPLVWPMSGSGPAIGVAAPTTPSLADIGAYFFKVGALTVGGGLTMIAFMQDQVVDQFHWLTPPEFVDGLALGQFTPGPLLMLAAYVGYKVAGIAGALVAAAAGFLPSFILMLALLPVFDRVRKYTWTRAVLRGMAPAVVGILAVSLFRLAPYALADAFAIAIFAATVTCLFVWRASTIKLMIAGAVVGVLRSRLASLFGAATARGLGL
jgi:chromate transporter